jgi:phenylpropionate dioxygenase-like ring-hydroxylating dioxygenase large terminal subunit
MNDTEILAALDDLNQGHGLPSSWYHRPDVLDAELDRIFQENWVCVGATADVAEPGDQMPTHAGRTPVVLVRDLDGNLRAFVNICRHRAHPVAIERRNRKSLQCAYHAWTYALDGSLRGAPRSENEDCFDKACMGLRELAVDTWGPFVFVHCGTDPRPLELQLGELPELVSSCGVDLDRCEFWQRQDAPYPGNWKNYLDNSLECYHCPSVHPSLSSLYDMREDSYHLRAGEYWQAQLTTWKGEDEAAGYSYQYFFLYPNFTCVVYRNREGVTEGFAGMWFHPTEPSRTLQKVDFHFLPELSDTDRQALVDVTMVTKSEDMAVIERVQQSHESGRAQKQVLLKSEWLIAHFQRLVCESLLAEAAQQAVRRSDTTLRA